MPTKEVDLVEGLTAFLTDLDLYTRSCLRIRTKQAKLVPFKLNRAQQLVHKKLSKQRKKQGRVRAIVLKARQEGVSTYVAARFFRRVTMTPHMEALVIADEKKRGSKL